MASKQKIFIPTYISDVNYNPARVQPRVLFYNGVKPSETYFVNEEGNSQPFEGFPYFDNYSGQNTTTASLSLLFNNEVAPYGVIPSQSLYTQYWETYVDLLYNPRTRLINASAIIPLAEYFKMELNDIVDFRGNYYHLRAINDYNLKTGECNIQLLGPILEDAIGSGEVDCTFAFTSEISTAECDFDFIEQEGTTTTSTTTGTTTTTSTTTGTTTTTSTTTLAPQCDFDYELVEDIQIDFLLVGGGGGGGLNNRAGGGGAGRMVFSSLLLPTNTITTANIIVGKGGQLPEFIPGEGGESIVGGANGENTVISILGTTYTAPGGGGGGILSSLSSDLPKAGGSGGGASSNNLPQPSISGGGTILGTPIAGLGNAGGSTNNSIVGASGGGAGGAGGVTSNPSNGQTWFDGIQYARGGGGGTGTIGGLSPVLYGSGGGGNACCEDKKGRPGVDGIVKIRYIGNPIATGGIITQKDGYTYHTFKSNGTFEFLKTPTTTTTTTTPPSMDSDAQQFILTANISNTSLRTAINNFVVELKDNNLWNKFDAIWPFVGDNTSILSTQFSINLKTPGLYDLTYPFGFGNDNNFAGFRNVANTNFNMAAIKGSTSGTGGRFTKGQNHMSIFTNTLEPIKNFVTGEGSSTIDMGGLSSNSGNQISVGRPISSTNTEPVVFGRTRGLVQNTARVSIYNPQLQSVGYTILSYNETQVPHSGLHLNGVFLNEPGIGGSFVGGFNDPMNRNGINWNGTIAIGGSNNSSSGFSVSNNSRSGKRFQMATIGDSLTLDEAAILNSIVQNFQIVVGNIFDVNRTI
jgi:hypothetical protein